MDGLLALTIVLVAFAVGDFVSYKTKSIVSMMFVASVIFLVGFWMGIPATLFADAQLTGFGAMMIGLLITHMGTLLSIEDLKKQWKTVLIALAAVVGIGIFLFTVGSLVVGKEYAVAAAPPIAGGVVAAIIMGEAATAKGLDSIAVFVTLLVVVQGFFGYPIASFMLNREAKKIVKKLHTGKASAEVEAPEARIEEESSKKEKKKLIPALPKDLQTTYILLAKLAIVAFISFQLAGLLNNVIHKYVMCLFVGVAARELGFLEEAVMNKANAFGLAMVALMAVIFGNLAKATPEMLATILFPMIATLLLGAIGISIFSGITGKLLGYSPEMAIAIGATALFGFPGTFIISNEVANANGKTDEERAAILHEIMPRMLVAGFVTVTIASVILAGFMAKLI
jgi:MFS family permease